MEDTGSWIAGVIETVSGWVWSPALVALCLLAGLYFSLRTRFVQVRRFGEMVKLLFGKTGKEKRKTGISSFQVFAPRARPAALCAGLRNHAGSQPRHV